MIKVKSLPTTPASHFGGGPRGPSMLLQASALHWQEQDHDVGPPFPLFVIF